MAKPKGWMVSLSYCTRLPVYSLLLVAVIQLISLLQFHYVLRKLSDVVVCYGFELLTWPIYKYALGRVKFKMPNKYGILIFHSLHHLPLTPRTSGELPVESQAAADTPAPMDTNPLGLKQDMPSHTSPRHAGQGWGWPLSRFQAIYIVFVLLVQVYCVFVHGFGPLKRLEFLPLLLTSVSCAVAVFSSWGHFLQLFLSH